jgi:hypothetical protein
LQRSNFFTKLIELVFYGYNEQFPAKLAKFASERKDDNRQAKNRLLA